MMLIGLLCSLFATAGHAEPVNQPVPLEAFFGLPTIRAPQLSPDGSKIAFLFPKEGKLALGLFMRKTGEGRIVLEGVNENVEFFFWKGNEHFVFGGDVGGNESSFVGVSDLSGKKITRLLESYNSGSRGHIANILPLHSDEIAVGEFGAQYTIRSYNIKTRAYRYIYTGDGSFEKHYTDQRGRPRLARRKLGINDAWYLQGEGANGRFLEVARFPIHGFTETWEPLMFSADNVTLYLISREEHDRGALYAYNTGTRERGPALFVPQEGEIGEVIMDYQQQRLLGVRYESDRPHYHWFDPARAAVQARLENTFPGYDCAVVSTSADEQTILVRVANDRDPGGYFVLDLKQPSLALFRRIRPDIDPARMRPRETVIFNARDGLELHGYLTRPAGPAGQRAPLVLLVHGGPYGERDHWGLDNEVQFFASRGYAVLQVNYRGSGGYGREFVSKGRHQWGRAMQDDLTDAVHWAVAQGIADPKRVAICGASYGGYAALAGVTITPELYCCAVNYIGVANLAVAFKGYGGDAYIEAGDYDYQKEWIAPEAAYAAATSPLNFVKRIRVPTLHAYGENDRRVEIRQWRELRAQLERFQKPYTAIIEKEQGHGFRHEEASLKFHQAVEKFFAENLAPEKTAR